MQTLNDDISQKCVVLPGTESWVVLTGADPEMSDTDRMRVLDGWY